MRNENVSEPQNQQSCQYGFTYFKFSKLSSEEISDIKHLLPISLIMWIPMAMGVSMSFYYHIRWQYFGITQGISPFYLNKFETSWDAYLWIASEMGCFGMVLFSVLALSFLLLTRIVFIGLFYSR